MQINKYKKKKEEEEEINVFSVSHKMYLLARVYTIHTSPPLPRANKYHTLYYFTSVYGGH